MLQSQRHGGWGSHVDARQAAGHQAPPAPAEAPPGGRSGVLLLAGGEHKPPNAPRRTEGPPHKNGAHAWNTEGLAVPLRQQGLSGQE